MYKKEVYNILDYPWRPPSKVYIDLDKEYKIRIRQMDSHTITFTKFYNNGNIDGILDNKIPVKYYPNREDKHFFCFIP